MLAGIPLLALPVAAYNLLVFYWGRDYLAAQTPLPVASGAVISLTLADVILALSIGALFVELVRAIMGGKTAVSDHALSTVLFVACALELLLLPPFATPTFLLMTLMCLLDVIAGLICAAVTDGQRASHSFRSER